MPTDLTETGGGFDVVQAYMDHVKRIDPSLANEDFSDLISAHRRLSEQANGRTALALEGSTVLCVTEDIPFLVDSVSIAIKARGYAVTRLFHPVIDGESWIAAEVAPTPDAALVEALNDVVGDVHATVADWSEMTELARKAATTLSGNDRKTLEWIADGSFTILGAFDDEQTLGLAARYPDLRKQLEHLATISPRQAASRHFAPTLIHTKSSYRSSVHRNAYIDVFAMGPTIIFGLMTADTYASSVLATPLAASRANAVMDASGLPRDSHSGKDLLQILESYPRDILMLLSPEALLADVSRISQSRTTTILHSDIFPGAVACLVVTPREHFTAHSHARIAQLVEETFASSEIDTQLDVSSGPLAYMSYIVCGAKTDVDEEEFARVVARATLDWDEGFVVAAESAADVSLVPAAYKTEYSPETGARDAARLAKLEPGGFELELYAPEGSPDARRLKVFVREEVSLTRILPIFSNFDLVVTDERPYTFGDAKMFDFGLRAESPERWTDADERFVEAVTAAWTGEMESDSLNALVLSAGLMKSQVAVLRALVGYLRQAGLPFSRTYLRESLVKNPELARAFVEYFEARFQPGNAADPSELREALVEGVGKAASLDDERIANGLLAVIDAVVRTNAYLTGAASLAFKLEPRRIGFLPEPRPLYEIWVYSPRVEGVHLRFGPVARGGLRWSDRREDFRTEILGLVKAQAVKNAVIVPTGSKGGFFAKRLPNPAADRDAWLAEGIAAYRIFIGALLDVTDNLVDGKVVPPEGLVRYDGDDTYLVVAADKGTATFSDIANSVSRAYGFWLDDAFASGGSAGFDHKKMGITARGAWESVKRHFRELGIDTQSEEFTAAGIGDMSGDVFGNGMLLSKHIRLVAAFDHRSIFLDPDPDPAVSFAERKRLFELPRSSWADYDASAISSGGGVWPRSAKSIPVSPEVRRRLGLDEAVESLTPAEAVRAILTAPVDLLFNGGVGTYVKASDETHEQIGDPSNNAVRVNGADLRCTVVGEGGNLGFSQRGRIEAALAGVRINTDAIDNSAGVDTSDHEVNIKILLAPLVASGELTGAGRDELLASVTDDVAAHVLRDNYEQNVLLGNARALGPAMAHEHIRLMHCLEERGDLDRPLEFLPSDAALLERAASLDRGLTSPEFSVLTAYTKIALKKDILESSLPDDEWFARDLRGYFPPQIAAAYADRLASHPLARQIVANAVANSIVNRGGLTFTLRAIEDTQAAVEDVVRAFAAAREILDLAGFTDAVQALDNRIPAQTQTKLYLGFRRTLDAAVRWLIQAPAAPIGDTVERFAAVGDWIGRLDAFLAEPDLSRRSQEIDEAAATGVPETLAAVFSDLTRATALMDAIDTASRTGEDPGEVLRVMFDVYGRFSIGRLLELDAALPVTDVWTATAQSATEADLRAAAVALTERILADTEQSADRVAAWLDERPGSKRAIEATAALADSQEASLASLVVVLRSMRALARS